MHNLLAEVLISARKLILAYQRLEKPLPRPIALEPNPRKGWYGAARPTGCIAAASQLLGKPITVKTFPSLGNDNPIAALVFNYSDRAEILVSSMQNYCWSRFLVAKELAHLLTCNTVNATPITTNEVTELLSDLINNVSPGDNHVLQAETLAYYAAIEILLPMEHAEAAAISLSQGQSILELASTYRIPRKVMEFRLEQPQAIELFSSVYSSHRFKTLPFNPING